MLGGKRRQQRRNGTAYDGQEPAEGARSRGGAERAVPAVGEVAVSTAGRDRGRAYVVIGAVEPFFVLVADGMSRRVGHPKRKNVRHLLRWSGAGIQGARLAGPLSDELVRSLLRQAGAVLSELTAGGSGGERLAKKPSSGRHGEGDA